MTYEPNDGWPTSTSDLDATNDRTFTIRFDQVSVRRAVIATVGILVAFSILKWLWDSAGHFIFLLMLAWLLSIAMEPSVAWLANHGLKRGLASGLVILGIILTTVAFIVLFGGIFVTQSAELIKGFPETVNSVVLWLNQTFHLTLDTTHILDSLNIDAGKIAEWASTFAGGILGILGLVFGGLFDTLTIMVFGYYLSADGPRLRRIIGSWLPARMQKVFVTVWDIAVIKTGGFVVSKIVLAAMSVGGVLAPTFVHQFERGLTRGWDPVLPAVVVIGLALAAFGIVSTFLTGRTELLVWAAIGLVFGGAEFASQSTVLGQVVRVSGSFEARHAISSMKFATNLAAPVGFVLWDILLDTTGGVTAMFVAAALMIIVAFSYGRSPTLQIT